MTMASTTETFANTNCSTSTILDILERWVFVDTLVWKSATEVISLNLTEANYVAGNIPVFQSYAAPQLIIDNAKVVREKLNNFLYFKADIEIDVKINTNKFQQGALLITYHPRSLNTSEFRAKGNVYLAGATSTIHRIYYAEQANAISTMSIPYANILDSIDLSRADSEYGRIDIHVLSPLKGETDAEQANVTIRARFVNVSLTVPTDNSLLAQQKYIDMELAALNERTRVRDHVTYAGLRAQMGEGEKQGPITRIANVVATAADGFGRIPLVAEAAALVGWTARLIGSIATVFGWSKPINLIVPQVMLNKPGAFMGNTEGHDYSNVLAQIPDNAINASAMTPEQEDEMALAKIFQRPNMIGRYNVPKSLFTQGRLLFSWEVAPWTTLSTQIDSNGQDFCCGSFTFAALMYKLWRGAIQYNLSCVKTEMHVGRIMAVYFPNRQRDEIPATFDEVMTTNSNVIFDLTAKSEDENSLTNPIIIPYTSNEPWKQTLYFDKDQGLYVANTSKTNVGVVGIYCLNELVCPTTVSQDVEFLLSHQAGHDFEVGIPQIQIAAGFATTTTHQVDQLLASAINNNIVRSYLESAEIGEYSNWYGEFSQISLVITASVPEDTYDFLIGLPINAPDGLYTSTLDLTFPESSDTFYSPQTVTFTIDVKDKLVEIVTGSPLILEKASSNSSRVSMFATVPARNHTPISGLKAEMGDAGSDPTPARELVAQITPSSKVAERTTGEYAVSLRPLLKRSVLTRTIPPGVGLTTTPLEFNNVKSGAASNIGFRSWTAVNLVGTTVGGGLIPESWVNLISYLYRFCAGSSRSKIYIPYFGSSTTSLIVDEELRSTFGDQQTDPVFRQSGIINNMVETHIPYYSQYAARTIGDQARGAVARQYIKLDGSGAHEYYESGGDDLSYFFMVGPPIMHGIRNYPVSPADTRVTRGWQQTTN